MNKKLQRVAHCVDASVVNGVSAFYGEQQRGALNGVVNGVLVAYHVVAGVPSWLG